MHALIEEYLNYLRARGQDGSARSYASPLKRFDAWITARGLDPLQVSTANLEQYRSYLVDECRHKGKPLATSSQTTGLVPVRSLYRFFQRRGHLVFNPALGIILPRAKQRVTLRHYLDLQEAIALVQSAAKAVLDTRMGTLDWARAFRNLALVCLALATGKRREALLSLQVSHLDIERLEVRIEREKGRTGRVVPVASWAVQVASLYLKEARPRLLRGRQDMGWLFPGRKSRHFGKDAFRAVLADLHAMACAENPDLTALASKHLTPHSLRVTFATLLFQGGCNIRSVNELMNHARLSETQRYTPVRFEDLSACYRAAHPRA